MAGLAYPGRPVGVPRFSGIKNNEDIAEKVGIDMNAVINAPSPGRKQGLVMSSPLKPTDVKRRMTFEEDERTYWDRRRGANGSVLHSQPKSTNLFTKHRNAFSVGAPSSYFPDEESDDEEQSSEVQFAGRKPPLYSQWEGFHSEISFPDTLSVLWQRRPLCTPIIVPSACLVPALWLSRKSLLALGYQMKLRASTAKERERENANAFLVGKIVFPSRGRDGLTGMNGTGNSESIPTVCIDRMDPGRMEDGTRGRIHVEKNPLQGDEVVLPVWYNTELEELTNEAFGEKVLSSSGRDAPATLGNCFGLWDIKCVSDWNDDTISIETQLQLPSLSFSFTVVPPLPLFTALSLTKTLLKGSVGPSANSLEPSYVTHGYLTLNKGRRVVPLLPKQKMTPEYPMVGIWVRLPVSKQYLHSTLMNPLASALQTVLTDPLLWYSCVDYLYNDKQVKKRIGPEEGTFLLAVFPSEQSDSGEEMVPLFLEVQTTGKNKKLSHIVPSTTYKMQCSMDASPEGRSKMFESTDTMIQCRFSPAGGFEDDVEAFTMEEDSFRKSVYPSYASAGDMERASARSEQAAGKRMNRVVVEGKMGEDVYIDVEEKEVEVVEATQDQIKQRNDNLINSEYEYQVHLRKHEGIEQFSKQEEDSNYGEIDSVGSWDAGAKADSEEEEDVEGKTSPSKFRPSAGKGERHQGSSADWDQKVAEEPEEEVTPLPWKAPPKPVRHRVEVHPPHPAMDRYSHQIVIQQQLQLQAMRAEIQMLRNLVESHGLMKKDPIPSENGEGTNSFARQSARQPEGLMQSQSSAKSIPTVASSFHSSHRANDYGRAVSNEDDGNTQASDLLSMHSATYSAYQMANDDRFNSALEEEEASSFNYRLPARRASSRKRRGTEIALEDAAHSSIDDDVSYHFERRRNALDVPDSFHIEEKVQANVRTGVDSGRLASTSVPQISPTKLHTGFPTDSFEMSVNGTFDSQFEGPTMTLDEGDFSLMTRGMLQKYGLLENGKVRSQWGQAGMPDVYDEDEDEDYSIPSFKIENPLPMREQTLDEDDVAEGASTKDGELNLLSNIRKMPKFK